MADMKPGASANLLPNLVGARAVLREPARAGIQTAEASPSATAISAKIINQLHFVQRS